ncbi:MAG: sugar ABC transporter permease [Lachnospiraceae bacterium]|nr:sugar ABC transporter permease [Lachnospiraceae bacterium]
MAYRKKDLRNALLFISPWIVGFLAFTLYPILSSLYYSFCEYKVIKDPVWIGLANYINLFKDATYIDALQNTLYMLLIGVPVTTATAITVSILLNNKHLHHTGPFKVIFFLPTLIPTIVTCFLWIWMFDYNGIVNKCLRFFGIKGPSWLNSVMWAKPAFVFFMIWTIGNAVIIYLAGLQDIDENLYEAAAIDGAGFVRQTTTITIPLLRHTILFNVVTLIIGVFQWFAEPLIITEGGPANSTMFYSLYLYQNAFRYFKMGYASAMGWILLLISLTIILVLFRAMRFGESYGD